MQEDLTRIAELCLDLVARPAVGPWRSFRFFGIAGMIAGTIVLAVALSVRGARVWPALPLLVVLAIVAFLLSVVVESFLARRERLTYYHHLPALAAVLLLTVRVLKLPLLPYFDACALAIGTTLAFARIGCNAAGCCHGRPHAWGVRYGDGHVARGFARAFAHTRLFPIAALEAAVLSAIVMTAFLRHLDGAPSGTAGAHYLLWYGIARSWIERGRGDAKRRMFRGWSEAQWISMMGSLGVTLASAAGLLPLSAAEVLAAPASAIALLAVTRFAPVADCRHGAELATIIDRIAGSNAGDLLSPAMTSRGWRITGGNVIDGHQPATHYAVSRDGVPLPHEEVRAFAGFAQLLRHRGESIEIVDGTAAAHIIFRPPFLRMWAIPPTHGLQTAAAESRLRTS